MSNTSTLDQIGLDEAIKQAKKSYSEGGIPIGSALVSASGPKILGSGHNQRIQHSSAILHGEMSALQDAGRLKASAYADATMVSPFIILELLFSTIKLNNFLVHHSKVRNISPLTILLRTEQYIYVAPAACVQAPSSFTKYLES